MEVCNIDFTKEYYISPGGKIKKRKNKTRGKVVRYDIIHF